MTALLWGVKASLLGYVRGMPDGAVTVTGGAEEVDGGFRFPAAGSLRFCGSVTLTGHGGMMRVVVADPAIVEAEGGWAIEIADPDDDAARLRFATLTGFDGERTSGAALTEDGADLFFGPYERGTPIDEAVVVD
ncbi:HtaA domain-containing protein [Agrococcus baldri]|uniref:Htaa domain-containing protein n=1 Tax=Agrococcus baldri TaxID=153730 RepID=A0AA87URN3_9MICO|nr:HtaA domain-containing protein [Agrococcus baldri]GEK80161.1 hypothetical protein ABA31_15120 [Agrococcus baldri]